MKIDFDSTDYQMTHGHTPRGRGSWAFSYTRRAASEDVFFVPGSMTFGDAKREARRIATARLAPVLAPGQDVTLYVGT